MPSRTAAAQSEASSTTWFPRKLLLESGQLHVKLILEFDVETAGLRRALPVRSESGNS